MPSFLHSITRSAVATQPFPHVHVESLIDESLCSALIAELPPVAEYTDGRDFYDDEKLYIPGRRLLSDPAVSENWKRAIRDNTTAETYYDFYRLFGTEIQNEFPKIAERLARIDPSRICLRGCSKNYDVLLEAQLVYFMPVRDVTGAERGPHVKTPEKIYGSFLCLRKFDDESSGHDFVLHNPISGSKPTLGKRNQVDHTVPAKTFPRKRNTYVGFLNTRRSVTQMTPRSTSFVPAAYMNILVELSPHLWQENNVKRFFIGWRRW
jgi:hypothetical protein